MAKTMVCKTHFHVLLHIWVDRETKDMYTALAAPNKFNKAAFESNRDLHKTTEHCKTEQAI